MPDNLYFNESASCGSIAGFVVEVNQSVQLPVNVATSQGKAWFYIEQNEAKPA
ncbi:MAG TPA: hypothetical protein VHL60_06400 [Oxalicibacterium sp.]|nr:hypothetical protein [Oxalicibacterium sp.]